MDVRLLEKSDIDEAKALWKEAFGDSQRFIDWYFANKVLPGNSVGIFDDMSGRLVSVTHTIPFQVCVQGRPLQSSFIAGAATAKTRRGQGLMRALLLETLRLLKSRGTVMTHLYPFKHSFYENFGWATYSYVYNKSAKMRRGNTGDVTDAGDWRLLAPLYSAMMSRFDGYVVRNQREWEWRLDEHTAGGGKSAMLIKNGTPAAYMLYNSNEGKAEVAETVYYDEEDIHPLLDHILGKGYRSAAYSIPVTGPRGAVPYGMARVVDAQALLESFGAEEALNYIRVSDGFAGWNNVGEGVKTDIGALAKIVHRGAKAVLSKDECSICNGLPEKVFSSRVTCIFEQY